ncbi:MAG: apolipoprotein N-acyltransferase [Erysipelotrichales bacterium]|nr:apolipoprotein N-acyltransferase [Erysipelotrichales bacterium]
MFVQRIQSDAVKISIVGLLLGICFSYSQIYVLSIFPLAVYMYISTQKRSFKEAIRLQFLFFLTMYLSSLSFLWAMYPLSFLEVSRIQAIGLLLLGWGGLSIAASLFYIVIPVIAQFQKTSFLRGIVLVLGWCLAEVLLEYAGFPWLRVGNLTLFSPIFSSIASIGGVFLCTLLWLLVALCISQMNRRGMILLTVVVLLWGSIGYLFTTTPQNSSTYLVSLIQGNISSQEKWDEEAFRYNEEIHQELLSQVSNDSQAIFLAETIFPFTQYQESTLYQEMTSLPVYYGAFEGEDDIYNSLCSVETQECYHKRYLVPFGEYIPKWMSNLFPLLNDFQFAGYISEGKEAITLTSPIGTISPLICYESIFPHLVSTGDLIYIASNDSWFDGSQEPLQHVAHARMRSIEQGVDTVRVGNTGITCIIDRMGTITDQLPVRTRGILEGTIHIYKEGSIYSRNPWIHNILPLGCLVVLLMISLQGDKKRILELKLMLYGR